MIIYFDNDVFVSSETNYTVKGENGVIEQLTLFKISPSSSIVEMQLVYKIVCLNLTSVNAA